MKQQERRRRAAEFLKKVGVDPAAAALPTTSLASAMASSTWQLITLSILILLLNFFLLKIWSIYQIFVNTIYTKI